MKPLALWMLRTYKRWLSPMLPPSCRYVPTCSSYALEAYAKVRKSTRPAAIAHRRLRTVHLGEHVTLQFEDEQTIRRQIQEMLHIEKIFDEAGIQAEIDVYAPLVPDGTNWKATLLIEFPDPDERRRELARLIGVEDRVFIEVAGHARVYAVADEDLERETEDKTSAVHFMRFELTPPMIAAAKGGATIRAGIDHDLYRESITVPPAVRDSLVADLA